jgi:hypothetical protein
MLMFLQIWSVAPVSMIQESEVIAECRVRILPEGAAGR